MAVLIKLRLTQMKGTIRGLFSKPASAIITIIVVLLYGSMLIPLIANAGEPPISGQAANNMILYIAGFSFMLILMTLLQNKRSLFFLSDAHYLYTGPFSQGRILGIYAFDCLLSAMMYGLLSLIPAIMHTFQGSIPLPLILVAFLSCTLAIFGLLALNGILYLRELIGAKKNHGQMLLIAFFILIAAAIALLAFSGAGFQMQAGLRRLTQGDSLNWLPLFGWARMAMTGALEQSLPLLLGGLGLLSGFALLSTALLVRQRGDFYERSMTDAEVFTEYYRRARSGQGTSSAKVHRASLQFRRGEWAIYSKNVLIALKSRELLRMQDILVIGIYLVMAFFIGTGFITFVSMLMFWMLMMASTSSMVDDLSHHYVYLIPGSSMKKLLGTLLVPLTKNIIVMLLALVGGGLLLKADQDSILSAGIFCFTLLLVFMSGNALSLRLLRSRSNKMLEQALRILLVLLALLPGLGAFLLANIFLGGHAAQLAVPIFASLNLLVSIAVLLLCAPMMQGNELNSD